MKIEVHTYFRGRQSNEQLIEPGVYDVGDPRLHGLEDFLVYNQQKASYINDGEATDEPRNGVEADLDDENELTDDGADGAEVFEAEDYPDWNRVRLDAEIARRGIQSNDIIRSRTKGKPTNRDLMETLRAYDADPSAFIYEDEDAPKAADLDATGRPRVKRDEE